MGVARIPIWFDPRGRLSRRAYGRCVIRLLMASAGLLCIAIAFGAQGWRIAAFAAAGGLPLLGLASLAQASRRLHDRDRSGWWLVVLLLLSSLSFAPVETQIDAYPLTVIAYTLATLAAVVWFLVETLGRRGTPGPNGYGAEPSGR